MRDTTGMGKMPELESRIIEYLRFVCAFSVVLIHSFGPPMTGRRTIVCSNGAYDTVRILFSQGICRVAVPLFFLIAGYLFFICLEHWDTQVWLGKLKRRVHSLAIPYILWNLIAIPFIFLTEYVKFRAKGGAEPIEARLLSLGNYASALWNFSDGYPISGALWFIRDLMVLCIIAPVIHLFVKKCRCIGVAALVAVYLASPVDYLFAGMRLQGLAFFTLGAFMAVRRMGLSEAASRTGVWSAAMGVSVVVLAGMVLTYGSCSWAYFYLRKAYTVTGAVAVLGAVRRGLAAGVLRDHPMLSESSFLVYVTHSAIFLRPLKGIVHHFFESGSQAAGILEYFFVFVMTIVVIECVFALMRRFAPHTLKLLGVRIQHD